MSQPWASIALFISSTFNDMHAERDYLVKRVFPELQEWCERRKLRLIDIDLRWGVSEADAVQHRNVVKVCLSCIDLCRPFFLCFLGQRRGWVPSRDDLSQETLAQFPDLERVMGQLSVTELEIQHALLSPFHPAGAPGSPSPGSAFFYLRDDSYLADLPAEPHLLRLTYTNEAIEDDGERRRQDEELQRWRQEIIPRTASPLRHYTARWNPREQTQEMALPLHCPSALAGPLREWRHRWRQAGVLVDDETGAIPEELRAAAEDANRRLSSGRLDAFRCLKGLHDLPGQTDPAGRSLAEVVLADLQAAISSRFPDRAELVTDDELQRELDQHEAFLFEQGEVFVERPGVFAELDTYLRDPTDRRLFVLTGEGGTGKSTLLACWARRCQTGAGALPGTSFHLRFLGSSDGSSSVPSLLRLLLLELQRLYPSFTEEVPDDPQRLRQSWFDLLAAVGRQGRVVLILDGLDQLDSGLADLSWLPTTLPENVKLVVSFRSDDPAGEVLVRDLQGRPPVWVVQARPFDDEGERRKLVEAHLGRYLKRLDEAALTQIVSFPGARNPLFLMVVLAELRVFGSFPNLHAHLMQFFGTDPVSAFHGLLRRLENDPGHADVPSRVVVPLLFGLLAHAGRGLSRQELAELVVRCYPEAARLSGAEGDIPEQEQAQDAVNLFLRQVRPFLSRRAGRFDFFYESFRRAALERYQGQGPGEAPLRLSSQEWHGLLASYLAARGNDHLPALADLPYHQTHAGAWQDLHQTLTDLHFLEAKCRQVATRQDGRPPYIRVLHGGVFELQQDIERALQHLPDEAVAGGRAELTRLLAFLRQQAHVLIHEPDLLPSLLYNWLMLAPTDAPETARLAGRCCEGLTGRPWLRLLNHPAQAGGQMALVRVLQHGADSALLAWSPDGRTIASTAPGNAVLLWDVASGDARHTLLGHARPVISLAWSPDGSRLATASEDRTVRLWDPASGQMDQVWDELSGGARLLAWSPAGGLLAVLTEKTVAIRDVARRETITRLEEVEQPLAWSPDGQFLAFAVVKQGSVSLWAARERTCLAPLSGASGLALRWSPDSRTLITAGRANAILLWDVDTGQQREISAAHGEEVTALDWSADSALLCSGGSDGVLKVWDRETATRQQTLRGHWDEDDPGKVGSTKYSRINPHTGRWAVRDAPPDITAVAWSKGGAVVASAGKDRTVRVWDVQSGACQAVLKVDDGCMPAWSPEGNLLAVAGAGHAVQLWDRIATTPRSLLLGHTARVGSLAWSPDGLWLASGSGDGTVRLWDPGATTPAEADDAQTKELAGLALSPDRTRLATATRDGTIQIRATDSGELAGVLGPLKERSWAARMRLAWSPDGSLIASADSRVFRGRLWDVAAGKLSATLEGHSNLLTVLAWSPDGRLLATGSDDHTVRLWDPEGRPVATLEGHDKAIATLAWSPDGTRLASASDRTAHLWDVSDPGSPRRLTGLEALTGKVEAMVWSPEGRLAVAEEVDEAILTWVLEAGEEKVGAAFIGATWPLAWSPDGRLLASCSCGGTITVWDTERVKLRHFWPGHLPLLRNRIEKVRMPGGPDGAPVSFEAGGNWSRVLLAWSPLGTLLASAGADATVRLWDARTGEAPGTAFCLAPLAEIRFTDDGRSLLAVDDGSASRSRPLCYRLGLPEVAGGEAPADELPPAAASLRASLLPALAGALGEADLNVSASLDRLARTWKAIQNWPEAEGYYRQSLEVQERLWGPEVESVALCCNSLGLLLAKQEKPAEAAAFYQRAIDILKRQASPGPDLAIILRNLGWLYQDDLAEPDRARALFREAVERMRDLHGQLHADVADALHQLGTLLLEQGDSAALDAFGEAVSVLALLQDRDPELLDDLRETLGSMQESPEAVALLDRLGGLQQPSKEPAPVEPSLPGGARNPDQVARLLQQCVDKEGKPDREALKKVGQRLGITFLGPFERDDKQYLFGSYNDGAGIHNFALEFAPRPGGSGEHPLPAVSWTPAGGPELPLEEMIPLFWTHPEHAPAWRRTFQAREGERQLLLRVLPHLPPHLGEVSFVEDLPGERFILMVTYDEESEGGRMNAAEVFRVLADQGALTFFGTEGSWGRVNVEWIRVFPDKEIVRQNAEQQLRAFAFQPLEYAAIVCHDPVVLWGIEDQALYQQIRQEYRPGSPAFHELMNRRELLIWDNLLASMAQRDIVVAGASVTMGAFSAGHRLLRERGIAHAGIFCRDSGTLRRGYLDASHQGRMKDDFLEALRGDPEVPLAPPRPAAPPAATEMPAPEHQPAKPASAPVVPTPPQPPAPPRRWLLPVRMGLFLVVLLAGAGLCWLGGWGWLFGVPVVALSGLVLLGLSLAASGWLLAVRCPRCKGEASLWRHRRILCRACGSFDLRPQ
jgi:WD40 repeat protein/tetratricopeptide (TPR) repeat protein